MLGFLLICLFIGSCHSKFDVSVTVLEPFYLYLYKDPYYAQLQLEFDVIYGDKRFNSYFFQSRFDYEYSPYLVKFSNNENTISSIIPRPLVLDSPIQFPEVSPDDTLDIRLDINPVYSASSDGESITHNKCSLGERLHNLTVIPRSILHSEPNLQSAQFVIYLSHTPCLNSTDSWFHDIKAQITIQVDFDCHGPCNDLFPTTTTTTPVTTPATTPVTAPMTTSATTLISSSTGTSTQQTQSSGGDSNKLVVLLALVAVMAVLELIILIGGVVYVLKKLRPNFFQRKKVEPSTMYYDAETQNTSNEGPSAPVASNESYPEMHDAHEGIQRNQENYGQNKFAGNALYGK